MLLKKDDETIELKSALQAAAFKNAGWEVVKETEETEEISKGKKNK